MSFVVRAPPCAITANPPISTYLTWWAFRDRARRTRSSSCGSRAYEPSCASSTHRPPRNCGIDTRREGRAHRSGAPRPAYAATPPGRVRRSGDGQLSSPRTDDSSGTSPGIIRAPRGPGGTVSATRRRSMPSPLTQFFGHPLHFACPSLEPTSAPTLRPAPIAAFVSKRSLPVEPMRSNIAYMEW